MRTDTFTGDPSTIAIDVMRKYISPVAAEVMVKMNPKQGMEFMCGLVSGATIMLSNGAMMRKVSFNDGDSFAANNAEWEDAIKATAVLATMPVDHDEFVEKHPEWFRMKPEAEA